MSAQHEFRFGVNMVVPESRQAWIAKCRRAEAQGYDVVGVADHLGLPAPFPSIVLGAEATERVRLNTFVLNTPFYNPALLARDVAGVDQFTDGRIELGLGAGYVKDEFEAAGIPFGTGGRRVAHLENTVATLRKLFADPEYQPRPVQPGGPPLLIAGWGDRLLRLAATEADVVGFTGAATGAGGTLTLADVEGITERVGYVRELLGERADRVELNILVQAVVPPSERAALLDTYGSALLDGDPEELPTLLFGTPAEMAQRLRERREQFGISYITVLEPYMDAFAPVIEQLR
ncbi:LLM class F420-dependent oxidoreductase [Nocardia cyriacigeorgica]|uniref:LLM class F420-dependent oxidoreductase n=1 Tax=Nocardia cyriacigeorgica TaxID=135487 RepID=A0A5R8NM11_9NOCA|nr:LLM class F420-dependent oxidoreductase [Nocardia cyriacigeorgica]TLF76663.1 LLM class F420-dependent oxidoreductase [Nocardia cyriacigeorgica]